MRISDWSSDVCSSDLNALKTHHHAVEKTVKVLQTVADALPALGIVAAVLGVVKTMGSIDQPPAVLGGMIGSALVGTFLGVLLACCCSTASSIDRKSTRLNSSH